MWRALLVLLCLSTTCWAQKVTIEFNSIRVEGKPLVGIQDCLLSLPVEGGLGFDGGCRSDAGDCDGPDAIGEKFSPLGTYSRAYRQAGFNTFRIGRGNCASRNPEDLIPVMKQLRADGWAIWVTLYNVDDPMLSASPEEAADFTESLVGSFYNYVDVWEVTNEARPTLRWFQAVVAEIRECDKLHRPIAQSWNDSAYESLVDINSAHWYTGDPDIPTAFHNQISSEYFKMPGKPLVFSELGNSGQNWSLQNANRVHDFVLTALVEDVGFIFWNTSNAKDYQAGAANIYLGPEERAVVVRLTGGDTPPPPAPRHLPTIPTQKPRKPCWLGGCN